jgi:hypothetical protein
LKYPKTFHLPTSPGVTSDDKVMKDISPLIRRRLVYSEKLDGQNTSMTNQTIHARSETSSHHPSQSWVKQLYSSIQKDIPDGIQIVGENVYAKHSIYYDRLTTFFYVFAIIDLQRRVFLSVDDTIDYCNLLGLYYVPILHRGDYIPGYAPPEKSVYGDTIEGYVIRVEEEFPVDAIQTSMAKFVRKGHVQTDEHWTKIWTPNKLAKSE